MAEATDSRPLAFHGQCVHSRYFVSAIGPWTNDCEVLFPFVWTPSQRKVIPEFKDYFWIKNKES